MIDINVPSGIDNYKELIENSYPFVDKTLFIKAFLDESAKAVLITRPRRFGKTLNMSMLYYFISNQNALENKRLFLNKKIYNAKTNKGLSCMDFQGQYPTIFLTFKDIRHKNYEHAIDRIRDSMAHTYEEHNYLLDSTQLNENQKKYFKKIEEGTGSLSNLEDSLKYLSEYLERHFNKKVIILLDEYDTPFNEAYISKQAFHEELNHFMKSFVGEAIKGNDSLANAMITGILPISVLDWGCGANNIIISSMLTDKYAEFFGFTVIETQELIRTFSPNTTEDEIQNRFTAVKEWYNGYRIGDTTLYNPWSVLCYIYEKFQTGLYWNLSGEASLLGSILLNSHSSMKNNFIDLLTQESLEINISEWVSFADLNRKESALWAFMLYAGYLKVIGDNKDQKNKQHIVAIPNLEVREVYKSIVYDWFYDVNKGSAKKLVAALKKGDLSSFRSIVEDYIKQTASYHDLNSETAEPVYQVLFIGIFFMIEEAYIVDSNKESGYGRYDIILIPKNKEDFGYIFELKKTDDINKLDASATEAIEQINDKHYNASLKQAGISSAYHVGIAFCGKEMKMKDLKVRFHETSMQDH